MSEKPKGYANSLRMDEKSVELLESRLCSSVLSELDEDELDEELLELESRLSPSDFR